MVLHGLLDPGPPIVTQSDAEGVVVVVDVVVVVVVVVVIASATTWQS